MMKVAKAVFVLCLVFVSQSIFAQVDTTGLPADSILKGTPKKNYNTYPGAFARIFNGLNPTLAEDVEGDAKNRITLDFDFNGNSNAAPNGIPFSLLFNNPITDKVKQRGLDRLKTNLKYEDNLNTGVTYRRYLPKLDAQVFFQYKFRSMRNLHAPKDAYHVIFFGNAPFENMRADLSNIRFQNYIYNQLTVGLRKQFKYGKTGVNIGAAMSLLQIINQQNIETKESWIFTGPDGEYLDFKYDLTFNAAKEGAVKYTEWNGLGGSGELYIDVYQKDNWKVALNISDLGFMRFKDNDKKDPVSYSGTKDSTRFAGIVLPSLTQITGLTFDTLNVDSTLRALLPTKSNREYRLFIPFTFNVAVAKYVNLAGQRFVISAGLQYKHLKEYNVYGYGKINYLFHKNMSVATSFGGGGYSRFNLGIEYGLAFKYIDLTLGSANIIGLVAPAAYQGGSVYFRLGTSF